MITWNNLDSMNSYRELTNVKKVNLLEVMSGQKGVERVKTYNVPMSSGLVYNYAAKQVDADVIAALTKLAEETQLSEKFEAPDKNSLNLNCSR